MAGEYRVSLDVRRYVKQAESQGLKDISILYFSQGKRSKMGELFQSFQLVGGKKNMVKYHNFTSWSVRIFGKNLICSIGFSFSWGGAVFATHLSWNPEGFTKMVGGFHTCRWTVNVEKLYSSVRRYSWIYFFNNKSFALKKVPIMVQWKMTSSLVKGNDCGGTLLTLVAIKTLGQGLACETSTYIWGSPNVGFRWVVEGPDHRKKNVGLFKSFWAAPKHIFRLASSVNFRLVHRFHPNWL